MAIDVNKYHINPDAIKDNSIPVGKINGLDTAISEQIEEAAEQPTSSIYRAIYTVTEELTKNKQDKLTPGDGLSISEDNTISIDTTYIDNKVTSEVNAALADTWETYPNETTD